MEVTKSCKRVTSRLINYNICKQRIGDAAVLVANSEKARVELGWRPGFATPNSIVETAWNWHKRL